MPHRHIHILMEVTEPGFLPASAVRYDFLFKIPDHKLHGVMKGNGIIPKDIHPDFRRAGVGKKQVKLPVVCS